MSFQEQVTKLEEEKDEHLNQMDTLVQEKKELEAKLQHHSQEHPEIHRSLAHDIIHIIEAVFSIEINGENYYSLEDRIFNAITCHECPKQNTEECDDSCQVVPE